MQKLMKVSDTVVQVSRENPDHQHRIDSYGVQYFFGPFGIEITPTAGTDKIIVHTDCVTYKGEKKPCSWRSVQAFLAEAE